MRNVQNLRFFQVFGANKHLVVRFIADRTGPRGRPSSVISEMVNPGLHFSKIVSRIVSPLKVSWVPYSEPCKNGDLVLTQGSNF